MIEVSNGRMPRNSCSVCVNVDHQKYADMFTIAYAPDGVSLPDKTVVSFCRKHFEEIINLGLRVSGGVTINLTGHGLQSEENT